MSISRASIEQITLAADLVGLIGEYTNLKKKGANWESCCPFHEEKSPSFKVNPAKGIYKCFGCGKGGDAISFVMDIESMGYVEALRFLAKKYNITLEESATDLKEEQNKQSEKEALQIVMNFAQEFFKNNLTETEEGKSIGLSYFKERGLRSDIIESFGLGYALNEWDGLMKEAEKRKHNPDLLEKAGLILKNEETHKTYDRFRGRVTFPILNVSGKVIAFGAAVQNNIIRPKHRSKSRYKIFLPTLCPHRPEDFVAVFRSTDAQGALMLNRIDQHQSETIDILKIYGFLKETADHVSGKPLGRTWVTDEFINVWRLQNHDQKRLSSSLFCGYPQRELWLANNF
jgi:DNA primase